MLPKLDWLDLSRVMIPNFVFAFLLTACGGGNEDVAQGGSLANPPIATSGDWQLVWEDEFDGNDLDLSSWEVQVGDGTIEGIPGWGNNELQYYAQDNVYVSDGLLTIEARADSETYAGFNYTSGRIRTQGRVDFTYGRVEGRMKLPAGQGLWSAFWLLGTDPSPYGTWAAKGEIDIIEKFLPEIASSAVHYGPYPPATFRTREFNDFDIADDFHVYAVEWDAQFLRFFIDGQNFFTVNRDTYYAYYYRNSSEGFVLGGESAPFDEDQHILLNLAVGGNAPGAPDQTTVFPAQMQVDYVRLYQCEVDPATGLGCEGSIDPVNHYISFDVEPDAPIITSYTLYDDGAATLFEGTELQRELQLSVYDNQGAFSAIAVPDSEGNLILELSTSGGGNVSLQDVTGMPFNLVNIGTVNSPVSAADFKFEVLVVSDETSSEGTLQVKIDSGFPNVAFAELEVVDLPQDSWGQVSVPLASVLAGGQGAYGGGPVDVGAILNLITFELTNAAKVRIRNVRLDCGGVLFCGIQAKASQPLIVFDDAIGERFDSGIVGYDTEVGGNYTESTGSHVSWEIVDTDDPDHESVIETTFDSNGASGVTFIGARGAIDLTPWQESGELAFDIKVLSNPNNHPMVYKLDGPSGGVGAGGTTGDQSLGVLPVGEWQRFAIPLSSIQDTGFDISQFSAFVLMPTFSGQDVVFQWDNIRFEPTLSYVPDPVSLPIDFEQRAVAYSFNNFEGGAASIVPNPDFEGNGSPQVAEFQKFAGATYGGSVLLLDEDIDFSSGETFSMKVWSATPASLTFKLEGLNIERIVALSGEGWETVYADFTGATGSSPIPGLTFILENGVVGDAASDPSRWTYYVDDVAVGAAAVSDESNEVLSEDFENIVIQSSLIGGGWIAFANIFTSGGDYVYGYGQDAPNGTGGFSSFASGEGSAEQGSTYLNVFSDYNNVDHGTGNIIDASVYQERTIGASETGTYILTFDVKIPAQGGLQLPAQASAFIQVLDPNNGYQTSARVALDIGSVASSNAWSSQALELRIDGVALQGQVLQYGFANKSTNYQDTSVLYDNVVMRLVTDEPGEDVLPSRASFEFSTDFESGDASASTVGGDWLVYVNVFDSSGGYVYGYGPNAAPNGTGTISDLTTGEAGVAQGVQYLSFYSDYANGDHGNGRTLDTSVFKEYVIQSSDTGSYRFSFDVKRPAEGGLILPTTAEGFIKRLDPAAGYATTYLGRTEISEVSTSEWVTVTIDFEVDGSSQEGQILQFGFSNVAANYDPSGIYVDNVSVQRNQ